MEPTALLAGLVAGEDSVQHLSLHALKPDNSSSAHVLGLSMILTFLSFTLTFSSDIAADQPDVSAEACLQVERGSIWVFEQEQSLAFSGVSTVVRMTVIRLDSGGLFVYSPVAPTRFDFLCAHACVSIRACAPACVCTCRVRVLGWGGRGMGGGREVEGRVGSCTRKEQ